MFASPSLTQRSGAVKLGLRAARIAAPRLVSLLRSRCFSTARSISTSAIGAAPSMTRTTPVKQRQPTAQPKPVFHVQPPQGWLNDPNGPLYYKGKYHLFYQHYRTGHKWQWGLSWGHAISEDLLSWRHLTPALDPTPGSEDQDGVWSGCAGIDDDGFPFILNTNVRQRHRTDNIPPAQFDLGHHQIESQSFARAVNPDDVNLLEWVKADQPILPHPHTSQLTGWRDPYIIGRPGDGMHSKWTMMLGAGYPGVGGAALLYTSASPYSGWEFAGELCVGSGDTGMVWECPVLAKVPIKAVEGAGDNGCSAAAALAAGPSSTSHEYMMCICPDNAHHQPVYHLGAYNNLKFDLSAATSPQNLDLGNIFYAPNTLSNDPEGRLIMWGWSQEIGRPHGTDHDYACCLSQPRLLWRHPQHPGRLWQEPLPQINQLRQREGGWQAQQVQLQPNEPVGLPHGIGGKAHLNIQVTFEAPTSPATRGVTKSGLLLRSHSQGGQPLGEASGRNGAAILYDWKSQRLDVVFGDGSVPVDLLAGLPSSMYKVLNQASTSYVEDEEQGDAHMGVEEMDVERRSLNVSGCHAVGGRLRGARRGQSLTLNLFLDHSLLEVFTSTGEVLTTRVYREFAPAPEHQHQHQQLPALDAAVELVCFGAHVTASKVEAYEMSSIWEEAKEKQHVAAAVHVHGAKAAAGGSDEELVVELVEGMAPAAWPVMRGMEDSVEDLAELAVA